VQVLPAKGCPWSRQGRLEQGEIAESVRPAVSLDLLRVKCRGNLSQQEESLLEQVLYQLRMLYVARVGPDR
jgi:hypothetical protein